MSEDEGRPKLPKLLPGERLFVARTKLLLNGGHLTVEPGGQVILETGDFPTPKSYQNLIDNGGVEPWTTQSRADQIKQEYQERKAVWRRDQERIAFEDKASARGKGR